MNVFFYIYISANRHFIMVQQQRQRWYYTINTVFVFLNHITDVP